MQNRSGSKKDRKATLRDVSQLAGVSLGSVSRYINQKDSVLPKTRQKIQRAIEELEYTPSMLAQNLAKGISNNLHAFIAAEFPPSSATWLYGLPIIQSINQSIAATSYSLQISVHPVDDPEKNYSTIRNMIINQSIDGLIYISSWEIPRNILDLLDQSHFPYVLVGNANPKSTANDVLFDNVTAVRNMIEHLYRIGHTCMGAVLGYAQQQHTIDRMNAFRTTLQKLGLPVHDRLIKTGQFDMESGFRLMYEIFTVEDIKPTVIICGNDDIAVGVLKAIKQKGLRIPEDISVIGFDNSIVSRVVEPALTTYEIPSAEMGRHATKMLLDEIRTPGRSMPRVTIPCQLIERDSVAPAR